MGKYFITLLLVFTVGQLFAQRTGISNYAVFGNGESMYDQDAEAGLMGLGSVYSSDRSANLLNPASLAKLQLTTLNVGFNSEAYNFKSSGQNDSRTSFGVSRVSLAFPIWAEKIGFAVALRSRSSINYDFKREYSLNNQDVVVRYNGKGGVNELYFGLGVQPIKGLFLGSNVSYYFGNSNFTNSLNQTDVVFQLANTEDFSMRNFNVDGGAIYERELKNKNFFNIGLTFKADGTLSKDVRKFSYHYLESDESITVVDTLNYSVKTKQPYKLPKGYAVGAGFGKRNNWYAGFEYSNYINTRFHDSGPSAVYKARQKYNIGGYWIPDINSFKSYWARSTYRFGVFYEEMGLEISNVALTQYGLNFGVGLPMGTRDDPFSALDVGLQLGSRGKDNGIMVKENFINLKIGINLNDSWFNKKKYY